MGSLANDDTPVAIRSGRLHAAPPSAGRRGRTSIHSRTCPSGRPQKRKPHPGGPVHVHEPGRPTSRTAGSPPRQGHPDSPIGLASGASPVFTKPARGTSTPAEPRQRSALDRLPDGPRRDQQALDWRPRQRSCLCKCIPHSRGAPPCEPPGAQPGILDQKPPLSGNVKTHRRRPADPPPPERRHRQSSGQ